MPMLIDPLDDDCFTVIKVDWQEERNSIISLDGEEDEYGTDLDVIDLA